VSASKEVGSRFGLSDADLKTPGHDALLLWVDANQQKIVDHLLGGHKVTRCTWEYPISNKGFVVGYWDVRLDLRGESTNVIFPSKRCVLVEIKTSIPSLGELVRQLRLYEYHTSVEAIERLTLVVSPDDRWASQLQSQGFAFLDPHTCGFRLADC
jgi:hypothetical protein